MSTLEKVKELNSRKQTEPTNAHKRMEKLFDLNSFVETGSFDDKAGIITGYGAVNGKLVFAYCQNGAVNIKHAKKLGLIYSKALKMGAPVVGIMDSKGLMLEDGIDAFEAYGKILKNQSSASGIIPQISIILGDCIGISSFIPALSDFVFMTESNSRLFMASPSTFSGLEGKSTSYEQLGSGKTNSEKSGIVHCCCKDEKDCFDKVRELIDIIPSNNLDGARSKEVTDDLNRVDNLLDSIIPDNENEDFDIRKVILSITDNNKFFEIQKEFADNIITGFGRFNGLTVGITANNGLLDINATQKAGEFINFCDAFNIPLLTLTNIKGYKDGVIEEQRGFIRYGAKVAYSFANASVPKVNVILRNGIGNAYVLMNSKHIGADIVYSWPTAQIALMNKQAYINIMKMDSQSYDNIANPYTVAQKDYIDDIIVPSNTRKRIIIALEMLSSKRELKPSKKHSSIEF